MATIIAFLLVILAAVVVLQPAATTPSPPATTPSPPSPPVPRLTGPPTSCAWTLYNVYSCGEFLSAGSALAVPPTSCCGPLRLILNSPENICLCHAIYGDLSEFAHISIDPVRLALLPLVCLAVIPPELPYLCLVGPVPPLSTVDQTPSPSATPARG